MTADNDTNNNSFYAVIGNSEDDNNDTNNMEFQIDSDNCSAVASCHEETEDAGINNFFRVGLGRASFVEALRAFENALPFLDE
mmetsp:Transcript_20356/g.29162  ORF Transcript_20356/g.29162 Transcript_20356/m.29162 type:complete len:83 (-) Transcript_20356:351-599(-)